MPTDPTADPGLQFPRPDDPRLTWEGVVSLERTDQYVAPWRLPFGERDLFPPDTFALAASMPAGVRIAFRSDATTVGGWIDAQPVAAQIDLCVDGELVESAQLAGREAFRFDGLPTREKLIELWLPQQRSLRVYRLQVSAVASLAPRIDARPRWTTYGSSITQCGAAASPTRTWPAIVARSRDLNLTCLGYGGHCHLEPMAALMVRDIPADFISICAGINIWNGNSLNARTFRPAVIGFIRIVREKHPSTPLVVVSPIISPPCERENPVGMTLQTMRDEIALAVDQLRAHGDENLHYVDGLSLFGPEQAHLLPDGVHPSAEGYVELGRRFVEIVADRFFINSVGRRAG